MPSATEPIVPDKTPQPSRLAVIERWNRKLHFYAGLFLLFFMWLFAFSGLLLNHPTWAFSEFWTNRKETNYQRDLRLDPDIKGDLAQARAIAKDLAIEGEIMWTTTRADPNPFEFQIRRPGHFFFIKADFIQKRVTVRQAEVNLWGTIKALHAFTGVQMDDPRNNRDWALTTLWAYSMDAVAAGLIFMVFSSLYMWFKLPQKRVPGAFALAAGSAACALFCVGLRWLF